MDEMRIVCLFLSTRTQYIPVDEIEDHHVISIAGGHVSLDDSWIFTGGFDPPHILPHLDGKIRFACRACEFKLSSCISPTFTNYLVTKRGARSTT
jgi:hypothetical protein